MRFNIFNLEKKFTYHKKTGLSSFVWLIMLVCSCNMNNDKKVNATSAISAESNKWIRPIMEDGECIPIWGHKNGIRIGLPPLQGPRGLLRVYAPYLGLDSLKMINFIALEPIVSGSDQRSFSELESSGLDNVRGKRFWSANDSISTQPRSINSCARAVIEKVKDVETLTLYVHSEPFVSGAKVYVRIRFYEDKPYEMELTSYMKDDSAPLDNFVLTATMGNFARLRNLFLKDTIKSSLEIWPDYTESNFTDHDYTPASKMIADGEGSVYFVAAPNEEHPSKATYADGTKEHWKYRGRKATQYWKKKKPSGGLNGIVNGRYAYWASTSTIPGGISFENFELKEPFENGSVFYFGASPLTPKVFIDSIINNKVAQ